MEILAPHVLSPEFDENTKPIEGLVNSFDLYSLDQNSNQMVVIILANDIPVEDKESTKYYHSKYCPYVVELILILIHFLLILAIKGTKWV